MSLLMDYKDQRFIGIAQTIYDEQFRRDPKLAREMDERRRRLLYDDIIYNISFLLTAVRFRDAMIFSRYARWLYELLCNLMKDLDRDRIMEQMTDHYRILAETLQSRASGILDPEDLTFALHCLEEAIETTARAVTDLPLTEPFLEGELSPVRKSYLDALLTSRTAEAHRIIRDTSAQGIPLPVIYTDILTKVMYEIGALWHKNHITVDKEHYATSVTQTVMSGFYEAIFGQPKNNKTLVSCAVGSELHEMGIRMVSDIFEYRGWDTYYMGAALPLPALLAAIREHKPDLVALSVTMPPYLANCDEMVKAIRTEFPAVKIAVGGQAFLATDSLWKKWDVDFYSHDADSLVRWADSTL